MNLNKMLKDSEVESTSRRWKGIMKCVPFEEKRLAKWIPPYIVQPKYDGDRCRNEPLDGLRNEVLLLSSEENPFSSVPHINQQLLDSGLSQLPLDGELYNHDLFLEGGHELIHSIASRTVNLHPRHQELDYIIFDLKMIGETQLTRMSTLKKLHDLINVKIAPFYICNTLDDIKKIYDELIGFGYEGIVIRHLQNLYEEKRSTWLMKFKPKRSDTYMIVGWNEEISIDGFPKGRIGSLKLSSHSNDIFCVSAGLNDDDRERLWNVRDELAGKLAAVRYQHLTNKKIPKGCFDIEVME